MSRISLLTAAMAGAAGAVALTACSKPADAPSADGYHAAPRPPAGSHAFNDAINAADFAEHVKTLASDEFEGRAPGSAGEDKTVEYLEAQFKRIGLQPGNGDSYFQTVPMVETTADDATVLKLDVDGQAARTEVRHRHGDRHAHRPAAK